MPNASLRFADYAPVLACSKLVLTYDSGGAADGSRFPGTVTTELSIDADGNVQLPDGIEITGSIAVDTIAEATAAAGVTVDGLRLKDAAVAPVAGGAAWANLSSCATGEGDIIVADNLASAMEVREASTSYLVVVTTNSSEHVEIRSPRPIGPTATAITSATELKIADSGRVFTVAQSSAYDVDLPAPGAADVCYYLQLVSPGAFNVTVTVAGSAATFEGVIVNDVTSVLPATGSTLTFASGAAALGDCIEVRSTSSSKYFVRAISSAEGGITIA